MPSRFRSILLACSLICLSASPSWGAMFEEASAFPPGRHKDVVFTKSGLSFYGVTFVSKKGALTAKKGKSPLFSLQEPWADVGVPYPVVALDYPCPGMAAAIASSPRDKIGNDDTWLLVWTGKEHVLTELHSGVLLTGRWVDGNKQFTPLPEGSILYIGFPFYSYWPGRLTAEGFWYSSQYHKVLPWMSLGPFIYPRCERRMVFQNGAWRFILPGEEEEHYLNKAFAASKEEHDNPNADEHEKREAAFSNLLEAMYYYMLSGASKAEVKRKFVTTANAATQQILGLVIDDVEWVIKNQDAKINQQRIPAP